MFVFPVLYLYMHARLINVHLDRLYIRHCYYYYGKHDIIIMDVARKSVGRGTSYRYFHRDVYNIYRRNINVIKFRRFPTADFRDIYTL